MVPSQFGKSIEIVQVIVLNSESFVMYVSYIEVMLCMWSSSGLNILSLTQAILSLLMIHYIVVVVVVVIAAAAVVVKLGIWLFISSKGAQGLDVTFHPPLHLFSSPFKSCIMCGFCIYCSKLLVHALSSGRGIS